MCGISGIYAFNEIGRFFAINLSRANEVQHHRGPDFGKVFADYRAGLGHRRLSILDLSPEAHQPFTDESGRYVLVYNGEIYNYRILREQLQNKGYSFKTDCDTEVLLYWLMEHGETRLNELNGFFAFAFYDTKEENLLLVRDRYGIKPLVYYQDEDKCLFASEIKTLLAFKIPQEIDYNSLYQYFQLNYIPAPHTIFKQMYKLLPGHYLKVKKGEQHTPQPWYRLEKDIDEFRWKGEKVTSYQQAQTVLNDLIEQAVHDRMVADVPLGAFLSGGIDSSAVVAYASRFTDQLHTFSVGYSDEKLFDETQYAQLVAKKYNTQHTVFELSNRDLFEHITELLNFFGEPFADSSAIPVYILSKRTRQQVTVSLSGDGADELFAGYNKYAGELAIRQPDWKAGLLKATAGIWKNLPHNRNSVIGNKARQFHRFNTASNLSAADRYWFLCTWNTPKNLGQLLHRSLLEKVDFTEVNHRKEPFTSKIKGHDFNEVLRADLDLLLPNDMLHKVDAMSMAHALEVRVPFLDYRIVAFANGLPAEYKINRTMKKRLLQDTVRELLPPELYRRPKRGFDVPLVKGYKNELREWIETDCLSDDFIEAQGVFNIDYIRNLKKAIFTTSNFDQNQVWPVLAFQHWWKNIYKPVEKS